MHVYSHLNDRHYVFTKGKEGISHFWKLFSPFNNTGLTSVALLHLRYEATVHMCKTTF